MRRFVLILMMVLLPLQWSWAAAASVCGHEQGKAHFGHHEHKHASSVETTAEPGHVEDGTAASYHPDCQVCHGIGSACMTSSAEVGAAWSSSRPPLAYGQHIPEPPIESLLRPPLTLVA